jgi:two-component system, NtrC family, sensor kinase
MKRNSPATAVKQAPAARAKPLDALGPDAELDLWKRLGQLNAQLRDTRDAEKVLVQALRTSQDFFRAAEGCVTFIEPGRERADVLHSAPADCRWDLDLLGGFLRGRKVTVPPDTMLARVRRQGRMWGALVVRHPGADFHWDLRQAFSSIGAAAAQLAERIDEQRIREVREQIDHKMLEEISPKSLSYQILHGIRSLIGYDHSAALLTRDQDNALLEVVGEQIAWRKAKSHKVGLKLPLAPRVLDLLTRNVVYGFDREGEAWRDWTDSQAAPLAELLDYNRDGLPANLSTAEGSMLCAPLVTRHGVLGVLKVSAVAPGAFGPYEAEVISKFLPQAAIALQNIRQTESLQLRVRAAERQQAMADLARGVSHDLNNAIGAVIPLVQQMQADLEADVFEPHVGRDDLAEIERSLRVCRRILGGMLGFARSAARNASEVYLQHEVDATLSVFREGFERHRIDLAVEVPADLPPLFGIQADIDQLLLNLIGNARDALSPGGRLLIRAAAAGEQIELRVEDNGCGIPPENLPRIEEPFFTTKPSGNGLGLSICRSIVSNLRGRLRIDSQVGRGTTVMVYLPRHKEAEA